MTDEIVREEKSCECPVCKILKCECCKKFLLVVVGSFIGCSLAILLFAPKPPKMPCPKFMHGPMMERQLPPPPLMHHKSYRGEFRRDYRPPVGEFKKDYQLPIGELRYKKHMKHRNFENKRPVTELPKAENAE